MSTDALFLLRAALEHHAETYGRWEILPATGPLTEDVDPSILVHGATRADGAASSDRESSPTVVPSSSAATQSRLASIPSDPGVDYHGRTAEDMPTDPTRKSAIAQSPHDRISALIPPGSPILEINSLDELETYVRDTVLIPLDATRTNPVFGVGKPDADLMVIGEAPGADEDKQGEPFVGRAGQLLTQILKAIGFEREDVYIANILKSRPPNNRDPLPEEVAAHVPILYRQIALIRPRLLLCVGKTAGNSLLGQQTTLGALRGRFHDFHGLPVMVTFHPAALLRNSKWKRPTWEDVQLLRQRYDELAGDPTP